MFTRRTAVNKSKRWIILTKTVSKPSDVYPLSPHYVNWMGTNVHVTGTNWSYRSLGGEESNSRRKQAHPVHGEIDAQGVVQLIQKLHKTISLLEREKTAQRGVAQIVQTARKKRLELEIGSPLIEINSYSVSETYQNRDTVSKMCVDYVQINSRTWLRS